MEEMGSLTATSGIGRWLQVARSVLADLVVFAAGTAGSLIADAYDRPRSAALIYLVAVMVVGARSGLARGIVAAIAASLPRCSQANCAMLLQIRCDQRAKGCRSCVRSMLCVVQ